VGNTKLVSPKRDVSITSPVIDPQSIDTAKEKGWLENQSSGGIFRSKTAMLKHVEPLLAKRIWETRRK